MSNAKKRMVSTLGVVASMAALVAAWPPLVAAPDGRYAAVDQSRLDNAANEPANWMTYGGTYREQRYSTLDQVNTSNVSQLGLAWSFEFDNARGQEATPIVVDGVMYTSTAWSKVVAIDAATGKELWTFDPEVPGKFGIYACCDVINRGVAVWKGKVYVGTMDGRLIAIDAATGKQVWSQQTTDQSKPYTISGAPRVFKDKVVIGNGGADLGVRGYVTAYDTETGKKLWRFYTVPGNPANGPDGEVSDPIMKKVLDSWDGQWWKYGGGGTVWDSIVYDQELDQLYIGVGNGSPWSRKVRSNGKGDNLFLASIVALDANTGAYKWHYQMSPGDSWDYTSTQQMMLATLPVKGASHKVLMQAPKNGFFYIIDRTNGKLLSAEPYAKVSWVDHVDMKTGRPVMSANAYYMDGPKLIQPSSLGGHNWHPMSYSPRTGLVYIPTQQRAVFYDQDKDFVYRPGRWNTALKMAKPSGEDAAVYGRLVAWDPIRQKEVWHVQQPEFTNGGTLATAGDLVFSGDAHGQFSAFRATDGARLWSFTQPAGIIAGPVTYKIGNDQYVAVLSGTGGAGPLGIRDSNRPQQLQPNGRVLVFKLGAHATLPTYDLTMPPPNPSSDKFTPEQVAAGQVLYGNCGVCHNGNVLPDLRRSGFLPDKEAWKSVLIDGALTDRGMVSFAKWLSPEEVESIRAYLSSEAQKLKDEGAK